MSDKSPKQRAAEAQLRRAIKRVQGLMPGGMGVAIFVFEHGTEKGHLGYISNASRPDMRRALTEFLGKWEGDAAGAPFYPLTLDAFEAWLAEQPPMHVFHALDTYRKLSNEGPKLGEEVATDREQ